MNLHIVTGASRGLGAALAYFFAENGDDVVDISRRKSQSHQRIKHFSFDLTSINSKENLVQKIFAAYPVKDYQMITLTNNAGLIDQVKPIFLKIKKMKLS